MSTTSLATGFPQSLFIALRQDRLLQILLAALLLLTALAPQKLRSIPTLVDWPTIAALAGLLALTKGLELSGALRRLGAWLVDRLATERAMALGLVLAAALLSMVLTNDVALFVVVPLTLNVARITGMGATRLIVFEALAVNAGSTLTPIGNPQNLFLWQLAGVSFADFVRHMLPLVAVLMVLLLALTAAVFPGREVHAHTDDADAPLDWPLLLVSLLLYGPFLVATDLRHAAAALGVLLVIFVLLRPKVLAQLDWGLLLVFVLMFVDLRLVAGLDAVQHLITRLDLAQPQRLYAAGIAASQLISNVPAAIALAEYSKDWRVLAYAVNVGGFGFMVGSLANLIALRMANDRQAWVGFHIVAVPALAAAAAVGYALLFMAS